MEQSEGKSSEIASSNADVIDQQEEIKINEEEERKKKLFEELE